jgi:hypothetical protein
MEQEHRRVPGVFRRDEIGVPQCLQCSQSDILQIPNGSRDYRKQRRFAYQPSDTSVVSLTAASFAATGIACRSVI